MVLLLGGPEGIYWKDKKNFFIRVWNGHDFRWDSAALAVPFLRGQACISWIALNHVDLVLRVRYVCWIFFFFFSLFLFLHCVNAGC